MAITKLMHIKERRSGNKSKGLADALKYIVNPSKTEGGMLVGAHNVTYAGNWRNTYNDMLATKKMFDKESGRQGYHFVISFPPTENVSANLAYEITREFVQSYLGDSYEALFSIHTDHRHMHAHIVYNSVSRVDGYRYHYSNGDWRTRIQPLTNKICEAHGLSIIELEKNGFDEYLEDIVVNEMMLKGKRLNHAEWEEERRQHKTWADFVKADIDSILPECNSFEEVVNSLRDMGWSVKWKTKDGSSELKHYAIRPPIGLDGERKAWIRPDKKCGYGYSREGIEQRLKLGLYNLDDVDISIDLKVNMAPKLRWSDFPESYDKPVLTVYQKKYLAMLYRTGLMARRSAQAIPKEYRADVCELKQMQRMVNYILSNRLDSRESLMRKVNELKMSLILVGGNLGKKDIKNIEREIMFCEDIDKMSRSEKVLSGGSQIGTP